MRRSTIIAAIAAVGIQFGLNSGFAEQTGQWKVS